jgi:tripartite-type tricarboxylate transporter receptor subunit TctC
MTDDGPMRLRAGLAPNIVLGLGLLLAAALAHAQNYPSRPIRVIVPFTPGTAADSWARLLGPHITQRWSVPVVVDNRSGAAGVIGIDACAKANPDGYTLLFAATAFGTLAAMNPNLPYDSHKDFAPVVMLGTSPLALVVANKFPVATVRELIEQARKQPGVLNYGSSGTGSVFHLTMEWFKLENKINLVHVPYKGTAGLLTDLVAGQVETSLMVFQTVAAQAQAGRVRMLAVLGKERAPQLPQVPTMAESGMPEMVVDAWTGVMAPARTPRAVIIKLNHEINSLISLPDVKETLARLGINSTGGTPEMLDAQIKKEIARWTQVVKRANIKPE